VFRFRDWSAGAPASEHIGREGSGLHRPPAPRVAPARARAAGKRFSRSTRPLVLGAGIVIPTQAEFSTAPAGIRWRTSRD